MGIKTKIKTVSFGAKSVRGVALLFALLIVAVVTIQHSQSAFSGTTTYGTGKTAQGATMSLGSAATTYFDVNNLVPGDTMTRCVDITYTGTAQASSIDKVKIYGNDTDSASNLGQYLDLTGKIAAAGQTCATATPTWTDVIAIRKLNTAFNGGTYDTGTSFDTNWTPTTTGEKRAFQFVVTLPSATGNEAQNLKSTPVINWEIRSKGTANR